MDKKIIDFYLNNLSKSFNIPINYAYKDKIISCYEPFSIDNPDNSAGYILGRITKKTDNYPNARVFFDINRFLILIGVVIKKSKDGNETILVGPIASNVARDEDIANYLFESGVSKETRDNLGPYLMKNRLFSFDQFLGLLAQINVVLNESTEPVENFINISTSYRTPDDFEKRKRMQNINTIDPDDETNTNDVEELNKKINFAMVNGLVDLLPSLFEQMGKLNYLNPNSTFGNDSVKSMKTTAIGAVFAAHSTVQASGINTDDLDDLKYYYLNKIETTNTTAELGQLSVDVIFDFTKLVSNNLKYVTNNPTINRAIKYIQANIYTKLTAAKIAKAIHISENYLFTNFKKEMKITLVDFINREKIKKAEYLLLFSDQSLVGIADFLSFSSQSYFQTVFKKITGMTPTEYRQLNLIKSSQMN